MSEIMIKDLYNMNETIAAELFAIFFTFRRA